MRKVALAVGAVLLGLVLAWLLIPSFDGGAELGEKPVPKAAPTAAASQDERDAASEPVRQRPPSEGLSERLAAPGGAPDVGAVPVGASARTPEAVTMSRTSSKWVQVRRLLRKHETETGVLDLVDQSNQLIRDMNDFRRAGDVSGFEDLAARQRTLNGLIRQAVQGDSELTDALNRADETLAGYQQLKTEASQNGGELPVTAVGGLPPGAGDGPAGLPPLP